MALLATTLTVAVAAPSQATGNPALSATKLFDAIPTYSAPPSTTPWFDKTFTVAYPGTGPAYLSSDPTGYYVLNPFDRLQVFVGGNLVADWEFWEDNCTQTVSIMYHSLEIDQFLKAGNNQLTLKFFNKCQRRGSDAGYVVIGPPGTHEPYDPPSTCLVKFFGVRGSGEHEAYGATIGALEAALKVNVANLESAYIDYDAIGVSPFDPKYSANYVNSVQTGINALNIALTAYWRTCPNGYVVLGGYSQGAEVIRKVFYGLKSAQQSHVASAVFFGDPLFSPKDATINKGNYTPGFQGIDIALYGDRATTIPTKWSQRFQDYCTYGDPVCNYNLLFVPPCFGFPVTVDLACPHVRYVDRGWVDDSIPGVVNQLRVLHVM